jgi:hypothetical protein
VAALFAAALLCSLVPALATPARAAESDAGRGRLRQVLDRATLGVVDSVLADAIGRGLPTAPIVSTALEGVTRGLPGARIAEAARAKGRALDQARRALGPEASTDALVAGASALLAGASPSALDSLAHQHRSESLVVPLIVLCDLLSRGVPRSQAEFAVIRTTATGHPDAALLRMRDRIVDDLGHGRPAARATQDRMRELLGAAPGVAPSPGGPP